jgi:hypothetical protein
MPATQRVSVLPLSAASEPKIGRVPVGPAHVGDVEGGDGVAAGDGVQAVAADGDGADGLRAVRLAADLRIERVDDLMQRDGVAAGDVAAAAGDLDVVELVVEPVRIAPGSAASRTRKVSQVAR